MSTIGMHYIYILYIYMYIDIYIIYLYIYSCNLVPRVVESTTSDDPFFLDSLGGCRSVDLFTNWEMKHSVRPRIRAHII